MTKAPNFEFLRAVHVEIDWEQHEMLMDSFGPEYASILDEFAADSKRLCDELDAAAQADDFSAASKVAHQIKGAAANFGMLSVVNCMRHIEDACRDRGGDGIAGDLASMRPTIEASIGKLRERA